MGTNHLIAVVKNNEYKVAQYGQEDGYPKEQGIKILKFLSEKLNKYLFEEKLNNISFASEDEQEEMWMKAGSKPCEERVNIKIFNKYNDIYPENSIYTSSNILLIIQNSNKLLKLINSLDFAGNSQYCEWVYVINLDKNLFEIYSGFNQKLLSKDERFYFLQEENSEYYPVKFVRSYNLDNLPKEDEFLNDFKVNDKDK